MKESQRLGHLFEAEAKGIVLTRKDKAMLKNWKKRFKKAGNRIARLLLAEIKGTVLSQKEEAALKNWKRDNDGFEKDSLQYLLKKNPERYWHGMAELCLAIQQLSLRTKKAPEK